MEQWDLLAYVYRQCLKHSQSLVLKKKKNSLPAVACHVYGGIWRGVAKWAADSGPNE